MLNLFKCCRVTKQQPSPRLLERGYDADTEPDTPVPPAYLFRPKRPIVRPVPIAIPRREPRVPDNSPA